MTSVFLDLCRTDEDPLGAVCRGSTIEVVDHGDGISANDRERVFDRLWRADRARSREEGRYGLGLPIAQRHAALIAARLEVESEVGEGSTFTVNFDS